MFSFFCFKRLCLLRLPLSIPVQFCLCDNIAESVISFNKGMRYNDVFPRLASIILRIFRSSATEFTRRFGFCLNIIRVYFPFHLSFTHINGICCFYNEVWFISFRAISPIDIELIRNRPEPFEYVLIIFEDEGKVKLCGAILGGFCKKSLSVRRDVNSNASTNGLRS